MLSTTYTHALTTRTYALNRVTLSNATCWDAGPEGSGLGDEMVHHIVVGIVLCF